MKQHRQNSTGGLEVSRLRHGVAARPTALSRHRKPQDVGGFNDRGQTENGYGQSCSNPDCYSAFLTTGA
eukprot:scaffold223475_cov15-Prasinocladus_malaysianus.AAC.1